MNPAIAICGVFIGCGANVFFLEFLVKDFPGSGNIITFFQFLFIAIEGFILAVDFGRKKPAIPLSTYAVMVGLFFAVSVVNNYAFNFNIPVPLHIIFRSGSLMANMVLGMILLKRRYTLSKYIAVLMITIGIIIATIASANTSSKSSENNAANEVDSAYYEYIRLLIGIAMLTFALFMSARMGIYQETVYTKFGKHPDEALFYNHALPLPIFIFFAKDIYDHVIMFQQSAPVVVPLADVAVPKMWLYLAGNVFTQYICIKSVFILTTECTSLTVTLVVTLRKFFSLLVSIVFFNNPFTITHWTGTALVFIGTFMFSEVLPKPDKLGDSLFFLFSRSAYRPEDSLRNRSEKRKEVSKKTQ